MLPNAATAISEFRQWLTALGEVESDQSIEIVVAADVELDIAADEDTEVVAEDDLDPLTLDDWGRVRRMLGCLQGGLPRSARSITEGEVRAAE